jgi:hypothetical protein
VVAIYGDPVVGRALELLLQGASYAVRFVAGGQEDHVALPAEIPDEIGESRLVVLTPGLNAARRDAFLGALRARASTAGLPVLQLGEAPAGSLVAADHRAPWPCRTEDLRREIAAALLAGGETKVRSESGPQRSPETEEEDA